MEETNGNLTILQDTISSLNLETDLNIAFHLDDGTTIGILFWKSGKLEFEGKLEESARVFFNFMLQMKEDNAT